METQNLNISSAQKGEVTSSYQAPSQVKQNVDEQKNTTTPTAASRIEVSETELSPEKLEKVVQQLQDFMGEMNRSLQFKVDEDSGRNVIKVIDKESGDLVKQYPSEEVLGIVAKLAEATGVLVDFKV